jgi:tetratricopeptide (TPR) repeat protein
MDLRVEDSPAPLAELRRLVVNMRAYDRVNQGDLAMEKQDVTGALAHYDAGMKILPDNIEIKYWVGVTLASLDRVDEAMPLFKAAFKDDPAWRELTRRLVKPGLMPNTDKGRAAIERILRETK